MAISIIGYPASNISYCPRCGGIDFDYHGEMKESGVLDCECGCNITIIANDNDQDCEVIKC